jgi:hypothetical protein
MGSISLGMFLVAGSERVPHPATGMTTLRMGFIGKLQGGFAGRPAGIFPEGSAPQSGKPRFLVPVKANLQQGFGESKDVLPAAGGQRPRSGRALGRGCAEPEAQGWPRAELQCAGLDGEGSGLYKEGCAKLAAP